MARIVINTFGSYGDVYPYIGLALALRRRGHDPVLAMPALYREIVEREGLTLAPVRPDLDVNDRALAARIMDPVRGTEVLFGEVLIPQLDAAYHDLMDASANADLIVTHPAGLAGPIVADLRGLPWVSTVLAPMSFFSVTDPVVPPPAPWVHALTSRSRLLSRAFVRLAARAVRPLAEPVQRFREAHGLTRGGNPILEGQHSPFLVLAMFSRVLGSPQEDWPAQTSVTGPVRYNGPVDEPMPPELMAFLDEGDPPIVFTLGTSAVEAAGAFYDVAADAAHRCSARAVLLIGRHPDNRPAVPRPNVLVVPFAPHARLFPRASVIVHQGGIGTLHQALASGRPMLVVPHAHDQPDNAHRATRLGVARTLYPARVRARRLARELRALLDDPRYRARAEAVARSVAAEDGARRACEDIDALLAGRATHAHPAAHSM